MRKTTIAEILMEDDSVPLFHLAYESTDSFFDQRWDYFIETEGHEWCLDYIDKRIQNTKYMNCHILVYNGEVTFEDLSQLSGETISGIEVYKFNIKDPAFSIREVFEAFPLSSYCVLRLSGCYLPLSKYCQTKVKREKLMKVAGIEEQGCLAQTNRRAM